MLHGSDNRDVAQESHMVANFRDGFLSSRITLHGSTQVQLYARAWEV